jgi:hypothetical protein
MEDLQSELSAIMAGLVKENVAAPAEQVAPVIEEAPTEIVASVAEPTVQPTETPSPAVDNSLPDVISDWDTTTSSTATQVEAAAAAPSVDPYLDLGKALGLEKVESKEALLTYLKDIKAKAETPGVDTSKIKSPELLKAIELDQKGGNWKSYLQITDTDYTSVDPVELYENYVIDQLADASGQVDEEEVNKLLDSKTELEKKLLGKELQRQLSSAQAQRVAEVEREAALVRAQTDDALRSALKVTTDVNGFKVDDTHRRDLFEWVSSGRMMSDLFYGSDGKLDPAKTARNAFIMKYFDKIDSAMKQRIRNATLREIKEEVGNAQIVSPGAPANPNPKVENGVDAYIRQLEQTMGMK